MRLGVALLIGAVGGALMGLAVGFVLRYVVLGMLAAGLLRALLQHRRTAVAVPGLVLIAVAAVLPPLLDGMSAAERRAAEATRIKDPAKRADAEVVAGAIDGCIKGTERQIRNTDAERMDVDAYCECFIDSIVAGPGDDEQELSDAAAAARSGDPPARLGRLGERCAASAMP